VAIVGGGGSARSGVANAIIVVDQFLKEIHRVDTGSRLCTTIDVSSDNTMMACSLEGGCLLLEINGQEISERCYFTTDVAPDVDTPACQNVAKFSPDGMIATGGEDGTMILWKVQKHHVIDDSDIVDDSKTDDADSNVGVDDATGDSIADIDDVTGDPIEVNDSKTDVAEDADLITPVDSITDVDEGKNVSKAEPSLDKDTCKETAEEVLNSTKDSEMPQAESSTWDAIQHKKLSGHTKAIKDVCFSSTGTYVASASADSSCRIWRVSTGELIQILPSDTGSGLTYRRCFFHGPDDKLLTLQAKPGRGGYTFLVEFAFSDAKWNVERALKIMQGLGTNMTVHQPSGLVAIGDALGGMTLVDLKTLCKVGYYPQMHSLPISGISFMQNKESPENPFVVTASFDKTATVVKSTRSKFLADVLLPLALVIIMIVIVLRMYLVNRPIEENN